MKNYLTTATIVVLGAFTAQAGLIVNGDFQSGAFSANPFATTLDSSYLGTGWAGPDNDPTRIFAHNSVTAAPDGTFLNNSTSGAGNDGFLLGFGAGTPDFSGTQWNLFTAADAGIGPEGVFSLSVDVAVLTSFQDNGGNTVNVTGPTPTESASSFVQVSVYGLVGTSGDLDTALANPISPRSFNGNRLNNYSGSLFSEMLATTSLSAVSTLNTWETQTFGLSKGGSYDYYLVGISSSDPNAIRGVGLDNIALVVPEPSTYIAGIGFIALGYFIYRRRKQVAAKSEVSEA